MGDPLSITSGVAGLISLSLTLCNGLHTYLSAIKDRHSDIATVTENLGLFKFYIFVIQSRIPKLGHSLAMDGVTLSLVNCKTQLKSLQVLLDKLMPAEDLSIWRKQKLTMRYPFDRKKLLQLEEYLSRANTTLSSFVQTLGLDVSIGMADNLESFKVFVEGQNTDIQTTLRIITTRLDVIAPQGEKSAIEADTRRTHQEERFTATSNNQIVSSQITSDTAAMKLASSSTERVYEDFINAHSMPRYLQNTEMERRLCKTVTDMECTCGFLTVKSGSNPATQVYKLWGGFTILRRGAGRLKSHRPGCSLFNKSTRGISKTTLIYSGLLPLLPQCLAISLTREYSPKLCGISFGLQPFNIVESSPVFRIFEPNTFDFGRKAEFTALKSYFSKFGPEEMAEGLIRDLSVMYGSCEASPFDVDQNGNNIAHKCVETCLSYMSSPSVSTSVAINTISKLLLFLSRVGVPITASNFEQRSIFDLSTDSWHYLWMLPELCRLATNHDSGFYWTELAHRNPKYNFTFGDETEWFKILDTFREHPEMSEDIGFSDIFLVILKKDWGGLRAILRAKDIISGISETDLYNRNILHISTSWPAGLKLLLEFEAVRPLLSRMSSFMFTLMDDALLHSKQLCTAPDQWTLCHDCDCSITAKLLLEADCGVMLGLTRPKTLGSCSLRARMLFFEHLKNRRERLRDISIRFLDSEFLIQYGITTESLPDANAMILWDKLRERQNHSDQLTIELTASLEPHCGKFTQGPESFFSRPHRIEVVKLACNYGFRPVDESGCPTLLSGILCYERDFSKYVEYVDWLLQHDLKLQYCLGPYTISALHRFGFFVGSRTSHFYRQHHRFPALELQRAETLLMNIRCSGAQSDVPCPCVSGTFNRPIAYFLSGILDIHCVDELEIIWLQISQTVNLIIHLVQLTRDLKYGIETSYFAKCVFHVLTMAVLGVRHLPICYAEDPYSELRVDEPTCKEQCAEILEEDEFLISKLDSLDIEFGEVFDEEGITIEYFLQGYWLEKMEQVVKELSEPLDSHSRNALREIGVVLEEEEITSLEASFDEM